MSTLLRGAFNLDPKAILAVGLMALVAVFQSVDAVIVRQLSPQVHPFTIGFGRAFFGLLVVLPWILTKPIILRSNYTYLHILRAALKLGSLVAFFAAFALAPLADVTAIAFTSPIFVTIGSWLFLGERPRRMRIFAVILGFFGVIFVLRPGQPEVPAGIIFALVGAVLMAIIQLILKPMSARDSTETLVAWNLIITAPLAAIPLIWFWDNPTAMEWLLLVIQGVLGAASMALITYAFSIAEATLIAPLDFLRLPLVALAAWFVFGESVPVTTWVGGFVIFASTLLMARSASAPLRKSL
ncbi:DMT family transporter [Roseobacter sp. HKCCD7870]|uniref:DMT family transporter n=1 Tax=Roseobacter sp. HKCCD7870 TaxID=3120343 RepID=UPI0030EC5253